MSTSFPTSGPFGQLLNGYFGNLSTDMKQVFWQSFIEEQQLTSNPVDTDTQQLLSFSGYVNTYYNALLVPDGDPSQPTRIIWTIFDILIALMNIMGRSQTVCQQYKKFLTLKQEQYRQQMAKTVLYTGNPVNQVFSGDGDYTTTTYSTDPSMFNFGYGNITLQDILLTMINQADQNYANSLLEGGAANAATAFNIGRPALQDNQKDIKLGAYFVMSLMKTDINSYDLSIQLHNQTKTYPDATHEKFHIGVVSDNIDEQLALTLTGTTDEAYNQFYIYFYLIYNAYRGVDYEFFYTSTVQSDLNFANRFSPKIEWQEGIKLTYVGSDNNQQNAYAKASGLRAEYNKRAQSFIDANQSRSDVLKDFSDQQNSIINGAVDGRQQTTNILQSVTSQLQNILNNIFK